MSTQIKINDNVARAGQLLLEGSLVELPGVKKITSAASLCTMTKSKREISQISQTTLMALWRASRVMSTSILRSSVLSRSKSYRKKS